MFWLRSALLLVLLGWTGCAGERSPAGDGLVSNSDLLAGSDAGGAALDGTKPPQPDLPVNAVVPPLGGASGGSGGTEAPAGETRKVKSVSYILIAPSSYSQAKPNRLLIAFSGTEGASQMASNFKNVAASSNLADVIFAVLDGPSTLGNGQAGADVLDEVRALYNIDNDRTFLLSESAGTTAGLQLGLKLRQSYFAAYWANDVTASATPENNAAALGFAPWGNAGPGGQLATATAIVNGMKAAGYRLPTPAPYDGPGSTTHGSPQQFMAAMAFFDGKSR